MTWLEDVRSPAGLDAVTSERRTVDHAVEVVTRAGVHAGWIDCDRVSVEFDGDQSQQWGGSFALSHPAVVPLRPSDVLDGRSGLWLRLWWRVQTRDGWLGVPCGTLVVEDSEWTDTGVLSGTVRGLDPLALAARGGYGPRVIPVGGLTVDVALRRLFGVLLPGVPVVVEASSVTLPAGFELWSRRPEEDWAEIAAMAGMVVRTDRMGTITARRPVDPVTYRADWREGPECAVASLRVQAKTSTIPRRVVVVSTSPDVAPPVVGEWVNPDADALTIITETRIESPTVTTVEAATNLARLTGERWARPQQTVEVSVPARPDLDYRDLVQMGRERVGVAGDYRVAGWSLVMAGRDADPVPMTVRMMARQS